ncbi:transforming growth factor-beta receptor-associated protein 1-like [Styela clava]
MSAKVFDLQLLLGRENIMGNKPKVMLESLEMSGKNIYVGANDGSLYHFLLLEDVVQSNANNSASSPFLQAQKRVSTKKPILQIKVATELKSLLINSDGLIQVYSMLDLAPSSASIFSKIKNVSRFYVNDHPVHANPFTVEVCVTFIKKKTVQLFQVQEDNIVSLKEISLPEHPRSLALDGHFMCVGTSSGYFMLNMDSNARQELLPAGENKLFVHRVAPAEFLLTAPNALGVFVTSAGISQRAPLQWSTAVRQACFIHPYVVAMDDEFITIHSIVDQQQKQTIPFQGGLTMLKSGGKVLVCTTKDIFALNLIPFDKQIADLLNEKRVEQAMELAKECRKCVPRQQFYEMMQTTYRKAGFVHFKELKFEEAEAMFDDGKIDIREIISLYPTVLPIDSNFVRNVPPYHDIANVIEMCSRSDDYIARCYNFLASYLLKRSLVPRLSNDENRESNPFGEKTLQENPQYRSDIFRSTIKVFAKQHMTDDILLLLQGEHEPVSKSVIQRSSFFYEFKDYAEEICEVLDEYHCFHAKAMNYLLNDDLDSAMNEWKELSEGLKIDVDFPSLSFVAEMLGRFCTNINQLWKHGEWILSLDQDVGVSIFTKHTSQFSDNLMTTESSKLGIKADDIIDFLHHYPGPVVSYLEHLVFVCRIQKEKYHTHLAVLYLDTVLKLKEQSGDEESLVAARQRLQKLLKVSNMYRISLILSKVRDTDLHAESVILHGKLGEHKKALDLLVNRMKDQTAAEEYCMEQSTDHESRKLLFQNLLSVYLSKVSLDSKTGKSAMAVVDILNKHAEYYDAQRVLNLLPKAWSISQLQQFLSRTVRLRMYNLHTSHLQLMLEKCENNSTKKENVNLMNTSVRISEDKICQVCNRLFQDSDCVLYPNGVAVHTHCGSNKYVCPVTGQLFKTLPIPKH